jgi:hypothetical protein
MVQQVLPWDALFLAGFAYSGYRTLGRWLKYTDDVAKSQSGAYASVAVPAISSWHVDQLQQHGRFSRSSTTGAPNDYMTTGSGHPQECQSQLQILLHLAA